MKTLACVFATVALLLAWSSGAAAQTNTGQIGGVIKDATGGVLPEATVSVKHPATGITATRITNEQGRFFFPSMQTGLWDITITLPAFATQTRSGVSLELGRTLDLEFTLAVAGVVQQISVDAGDVQLQTTTAEISDVIENREVVQIPLNGRNFLALAQLSDAVVIPPGGTRGEALQQAGPLPNVGGQRSGHNIYLLDGAKVTDELFNNLVINPSVDSIQEFKIQKSMYPAEFGGKASALINVSTKAGGNSLHGSLFEFYRNDALDAPNYFARNSPKPPLRQNQFGGSLGGPLKRDQTFFFASYEGLRMRRSLTKTFSVPGDTLRAGNFSELTKPICEFVASGAYELPFKGIFSGWRITSVFTAQTGAPFTVNLSVDQANIGAGPAQRPNQLSSPNLSGGKRTPDHWFDTAAFTLPVAFTFGDAPRNSVIGPGFSNLDLAVSKTWALVEPVSLELRWETFNLLNHTNFDLPNRTFSTSTTNFGRIFSAKSPREMQIGLRVSF